MPRRAIKINLSGLYQALGEDSVVFFYDKLHLRSIEYKNVIDRLAGRAKDYHVVYIDANKYLQDILDSGIGEAIFRQSIAGTFVGGRPPVLILTDKNRKSGFCLRHLPLDLLEREVGLFFNHR